MNNGFTKLFSQLIGSSIWRSPNLEHKVVWITMLAMSDMNGFVEASVPGLADFAKVSIEGCRSALESFKSPDFDSRSREFEGRKIKEVENGWMILNYAKYRDKMNAEETKAKRAIWEKDRRARIKAQQIAAQKLTDIDTSTWKSPMNLGTKEEQHAVQSGAADLDQEDDKYDRPGGGGPSDGPG